MNTSLQTLKITLLNVGHAHLNRNWNYNNVVSPFSRLYFIRNGKGVVRHHNCVFPLLPGYIYLIPSFTDSHYKCDHSLEQYYLHFLEEVGSGLSIYNIKSFRYEAKASPIVRKLLHRLLEINPQRSLSGNDPKSYENAPSLKKFQELNDQQASSTFIETNGIIQILLSQFMEEKKPLSSAADYNKNKITESIYFLSERLSSPLSVEQLAQRCHMNTDYFSRLFKECTGIRPAAYIQQKRIERAQILLTTTNFTMQEIADMVGLSNISYFSRLFLKLSKKTPGSYRKEYWSI
jgi:AraC-like DNA-binding protein